jgi:hypothetical protein
MQIGAPPHALPGVSRGTHPEEGLEDVIEIEAWESAHATEVTHGAMSVAVVGPPLLGVAQHLIGFVDFFEALLRSVLSADVGVVLARQFAEAPPNLFLVSGPAHAQNFVVVASSGHD